MYSYVLAFVCKCLIVLCKRYISEWRVYLETSTMHSFQLYPKALFPVHTRSLFLLKRREKAVADSKIEINPNSTMQFIRRTMQLQIIWESLHGKVSELFLDLRGSPTHQDKLLEASTADHQTWNIRTSHECRGSRAQTQTKNSEETEKNVSEFCYSVRTQMIK